MNRFYAEWILASLPAPVTIEAVPSLGCMVSTSTLWAMKRLRVPGRRKADPGDPDRHIPSPASMDGGLQTGLENRIDRYVRDDPRARGSDTRSPDETATRRHLEGAEQGPA
jgi:hypothetical protein